MELRNRLAKESAATAQAARQSTDQFLAILHGSSYAGLGSAAQRLSPTTGCLAIALPAMANTLEDRMKEFKAKNPMPDPAPFPFNDPKEIPSWIDQCIADQGRFNRWDLARFEYGIERFNVYRKAGARNAFLGGAEQTNPPAATCACLAEKRATALAAMSLESADSLIATQYQRCRRAGS